MQFEWDENKNQINKRIHGIGFEEAVLVFLDEKRIEKYDWKHSTDEEDRWNVIGNIGTHTILFVVSTDRGDKIRMISARPAEEDEIDEYYRDYDAR